MIDLVRMRQLMKRMPSMLWQVQLKEANAARATANITGMPRGSSGINKAEEAKLELIIVKDAYREAMAELEKLRSELEPIILKKITEEDERGIIRMRYIHGYDPEEIADAIFLHPRTVYRKLKRAERKLMDGEKVVSKCQ